ncbi:hypothetical protein LTR97_005914 [Elasticomyces elasticus]|uniref:Uncharacterized protein n=1 Tax=Elasticomyces elasticus TaxID=574655 RepID=A0AAN7WAZ0_9PEZI|nr:hypothetical protein LTR97_005914 [Elasticomyces elasticus]
MALNPRRPFGDITPSFIKAASKKATRTETTSTKVTSKKTTTKNYASNETAVEGNFTAKKTAAEETAIDRIATKEKTIKTTADLVLEFELDLYKKREPKKKTAKHDFKIHEDIEIYEDPEPVIDSYCTGPTSVSPAVVERINFINYLATKDMGRNPNCERYDPVSGMMVGEIIDEFAEMFGSLGAPWANLEEYDSYVWEMELLRNREESMAIWDLEDCVLPTEEPFAEWEDDNDSGVGLPTEEPFAEWEEGNDSVHVKESDLPQSLSTEEPFAEWEEEDDSGSLHALLLKEREHQALEDAERAEWEERVNWKE